MTKTVILAAFLSLALAGPATAAMTPDGKMIPVPEYDQAEVFVKAGAFEKAMPLLLETLRRYPTHASAWNLLGFMARKDGDVEKAASYYERALKVNPAHLGALNYQGHLYMETGQPEKARANLDLLGKACAVKCPEFLQLKERIESGLSGKYAD
ncbi:tetratricopeptide repeat protein [Aestuariispira insulae]|uniref:Tetratricopeptide repeat protein n=1 Tax=Aestuariispira insulae TaxID=1461337 RepID=A0A3D9HWW2_9PROT|nr:tetratricopeptide repeat protein [Aestuariispira insulae]RED53905.1 tetratricopeptide repeat protein [Aestuariispira insulae]